ncbi:MAG: GerMN domain-containing protein [Acidimicrobiales bacterium]
MRGRFREWRLAAIVVIVMSAPALVGCGIPTGGSPTVISKDNVPFGLLKPVPAASTNTTVPHAVTVPESIFLVAPSQHLVAVTRDIEVPASLGQILGALLDGPTQAEATAGLQSFLTGTKVQVTTSLAGGVATVDFSANPIQVVGPDQTLAIAQVVFTATQQAGVNGVVFEIEGHPISVPTAAGAQVSTPVNRTNYQPQAPVP